MAARAYVIFGKTSARSTPFQTAPVGSESTARDFSLAYYAAGTVEIELTWKGHTLPLTIEITE